MSSSFDAGTVYKKYIKGEPFTDQEILQGIEHFMKMEHDLRHMGPEFKFSADAIMHVRIGLVGFQHARRANLYK